MNSGNRDEAGAERTLDFFCRHLVALCVTYRPVKNGMPIEKQRFFACPGVVIRIRGFFSFLTAGHALKDLHTHLERGDIAVESAVLADTFGSDVISDKPIPFDLLNEPRFFIDNEEEFDAYTMLGLPEEFVKYEQDGSVGIVSPTMIGVKALDIPPEDTKPTSYPRFVGKLQENLPFSSIVGMSGGPIFGFRYGPPMAYWIVAIQSSWLQSQRIIFGCPLSVLAELLTTWIDELNNKGEFRVLSEEEQNDGSQ